MTLSNPVRDPFFLCLFALMSRLHARVPLSRCVAAPLWLTLVLPNPKPWSAEKWRTTSSAPPTLPNGISKNALRRLGQLKRKKMRPGVTVIDIPSLRARTGGLNNAILHLECLKILPPPGAGSLPDSQHYTRMNTPGIRSRSGRAR